MLSRQQIRFRVSVGNQRHPSRSVVTWMIHKLLKEHSSLSSELTLEKKNTIYPIFHYSTTGSDHAGLPLRGWMEKASWDSIMYTWNSKSMGLLHVRGMLRRMLQTGKKIKSIFFQLFNSNAWNEVCLAVWKNPNWQASQNTGHWKSQHTHTHTFVRAVLLGGQGGKGCAGQWWQGNHELELKGSRPPLKAHIWVWVRKRGKKT